MFSQRFSDLATSFRSCVYTAQEPLDEEEAFHRALALLSEVKRSRGIVYVIANGGSAGIASHFSNDLMKTLGIPSQTLYDSNLMTCLSNDIGYDQVFSYPLQKLLRPNDLLVAISSSGQSPNILRGAQAALDGSIPLITLSGFRQENPLRKMGQLNFWVDASHYGLVETVHFFLLHTLVDLWKE